MRFLSKVVAAVALASGMAGTAHAQDYPQRAVTIVVPYAPGGSTDILARLLAEGMQKHLGQSVVVENKGGAGSALGTQHVAQSPPDGYTLLMASSAHTINPAIRGSIGYDPVKDFTPISRLVTIPHVMVVAPTFPAKTVAEVIAYAKAHPGKVNYGSSGPGTSNHLEAELFASKAGIDLTHVPYRGIGPAITDLMASRLQMIIGSLSSLQPSIDGKAVRPMAVTSLNRVPTAPDLPTIAESGIPGFETVDWLGLLAPGRTDPRIIEKLEATIKTVMSDQGFLKRLTDLGFVPEGSTRAQFAEVIANDVWSKTARELGVRVSD